MIDSRAKNAFPTYFKSRQAGDGGDHWFWIPYDMDTAIGIDNKGKLSFDYNLEDTDKLDGADVFNGQDSVMWCNLRDSMPGEVKATSLKASYEEEEEVVSESEKKVEEVFDIKKTRKEERLRIKEEKRQRKIEAKEQKEEPVAPAKNLPSWLTK